MIIADNKQHTEFRQTNADAHRVTPIAFEPPALICHQAFWISPGLPQSDLAERREHVKEAIDGFILETARNIKSIVDHSVRLAPFVGNLAVLFSKVVDCKTLIFSNALFRSGDDTSVLNDQQRAITGIFDSDHRVVSILFHWTKLRVTIRFEMHGEYFVVTSLIEGLVADGKPTLAITLDQLARYNELSPHQATAVARYLYETIWNDFSQIIFPARQSPTSESIFFPIFVDARGLVVSTSVVSCDELKFAEPTAWPSGAKSLAEKCLPLLFPIGASRDRRYECSASYLLDGRAIYMTSLGPQIPEATARRRVPVTYLLCTHPSLSSWERGRIIDLVQLMGTSRLAALRDLSALRTAGRQLATLDRYILDARAEVPSSNDEARTAIRDAHDQFNEVTRKFNATTRTDYGISYRVERSRYYVSKFRSNISQLRMWSVEGFQKYDLFVEQRLGSTFDFIDRLGMRYGRASSSLSLLDEYYLSIQSNQIAERQREISQRQAATVDRETTISNAIQEIQKYGEFILIAALLPYYLLGLVSHILASHHAVKYWSVLIWAGCFYLAMRREYRKETTVDGGRQPAERALYGVLNRYYRSGTLAIVIGVCLTLWASQEFVAPIVRNALEDISHWLPLATDSEIQD
jgi:hypothetical protein